LSWGSGPRSAEGDSGHSLLVVALQPARILAAKGLPGAEWPFRSLGPGGRAGARACDLTQSAQLRGPTMEYLEKVRSQFLSLRQSLILQKYFKASQFARHFLRLAAVFAAVLN
jgi:hypothetical protein